MKKLMIILVIAISLGCNSKKQSLLNDFKINGNTSLIEGVKIHAEIILENMTRKRIILYQNKKVFTPPKNVLRYEFEISYNDSIYAKYGSDNKIKANQKYGKYHFYFFQKDANIYVNIDLISENRKYNSNSIILKRNRVTDF